MHGIILRYLARRAGTEPDHLLAIVKRARRAEASQLDILWLCYVVDPNRSIHS